jgi:hypothetical protein
MDRLCTLAAVAMRALSAVKASALRKASVLVWRSMRASTRATSPAASSVISTLTRLAPAPASAFSASIRRAAISASLTLSACVRWPA